MRNKVITEIKNNRVQLLLLFIYTTLVVFFCSKMSPFYSIQEWSDVNLYFNIGKAIMNGQTLYLDVFDHKGPYIFLIYGIGYLISNHDFLGMFFIQVSTWYILICAAYFIARLYLSKIYSYLVGLIFLLTFISHTLQGGAAEEFVTACMATSLYLFVRYFRNPQKHRLCQMYLHGLMWGISFFIKFNLVVFWFFPLLAIGLILLSQKRYKNLLLCILSFVLGAVTTAVPLVIYFCTKDGFLQAIDSYFILNTSFNVNSPTVVFSKVITSLYQRLRFEPIEFGLILTGAFLFPMLHLRNHIAKLGIAFSFLAVFTIVFMAGYVYYYSIPYYLFVILGCIVVASLISRFRQLENSILLALCALFITLAGSTYRKEFFGKYKNKENMESGNVVEQFAPIILQEEDRSLINLGFDDANALFTYADILPTVKYFTAPNLQHSVYPELRDEQTKYIEESRTMFVVLAEYTNNAQYFRQLKALDDNYEVVDKFAEYYSWHNVDRFYYLYKRKNNK